MAMPFDSLHWRDPADQPPSWMSQEYDVWFRDPRLMVHKILGNHSFAGKIDLRPFQEYTTDDQTRQYKDFMSGNWAWDQAVCLFIKILIVEVLTSHANEHSGGDICPYHSGQ